MENKRKVRHFSKSLFSFWIFSYASILILPVIFLCISYFIISHTMKTELENTNTILLKNVQTVIDNKIEVIIDMGIQFSMNSKIKNLVSDDSLVSTDQRIAIYQLQKDFLKVYQSANKDIEKIYVFMPNQKYVFSSDNSFSISTNGVNVNSFEQIDFKQWDGDRQGYKAGLFQLQPTFEGTDNQIDTIAYIRSIPWEITSPNQMLLVVVLNRALLVDILKDIQVLLKSTVTILDSDGKPLITSGKVLPQFPEGIYQQLADNEARSTNMGGQKTVLTSISSTVLGWKYVLATPEYMYIQKLKDVSDVFLLSLVLSITIGGIMNAIFVHKSYSPVRKIIAMMVNSESKSYNNHIVFGEFNFIEKSIQDSINDKLYFKEQLDLHSIKQSENWVCMLLNGGYSHSNALIEFCTKNFSMDSFGVLLVQYKSSESGIDVTSDIKCAINYGLVEVVNQEFCNWFIVELNRKMICLLNFNSLSHNFSESDIRTIAHQIFSNLTDEHRFSVSISTSNTHRDISNIQTAYQEALEAIQYLNMMDIDNSVITYEEILSKSGHHSYTLQTEQHLINCIKLGDYAEAVHIAHKMLDNKAISVNMSPSIVRLLMKNMANTVINLISEIYIDDEAVNNYDPIIDKLLRIDNINQYQLELFAIFQTLCNEVNTNKVNLKVQYMNSIIDYIQKNYNDQRLNVSFVTSKFGLTPSYLSKKFKDFTGESLLEYINKTRLSHVKELLGANQLNLDQITHMVGFANSNSLIRIFKKYEYTTPGKYKELYISSSANP